jgi:hypothetical protein
VDAQSPGSSVQLPGATGVAVLEVQVSNLSALAATLTGMTLSATGSGVDNTGIAMVRIWLDANDDGIVDGSDLLLGSGSYPTDNGTAVIVLNAAVGAGESVHLLVVDDFSALAPEGTYQANINAGGLSATSSSGAAQFTGLPSTGAVITIMHPTATPTWTATVMPSATPSETPTHTATFVPTATRTPTPVPTATATVTPTRTDTPSFTPTTTPTPSVTPTGTHTPSVTETPTATEQPGNDKPILYPNPSDGTQLVSIHVPGRTGTSDVTVRIFTVAFRLVQQEEFPRAPLGADVKIELKDKSGMPLASGLYYVVVTIDGNKSVGKLLLLR